MYLEEYNVIEAKRATLPDLRFIRSNLFNKYYITIINLHNKTLTITIL